MTNIFAVFLHNKPDLPAQPRIDLARRLADHPETLGLPIVEALIMPSTPGIVALLLVEASDAGAVATAMAQTDAAFTYDIVETTNVEMDEAAPASTMMMLGIDGARKLALPDTAGMIAPPCRFKADLGTGGPADALWLTTSDQPLASAMAMEEATGLGISSRSAMSAAAFIALLASGSRAPSAAAAARALAQAPTAAVALDAQPSITLQNTGSSKFWAATINTSTWDYRGIEYNKVEIDAGNNYAVAGPIYIWKSLPGTFGIYIEHALFTIGHVTAPTSTVSTTFCAPDTVIQGIAGTAYQLDLDKSNVPVIPTAAGKLLSDLLTTPTYDLPWPEDSYTGDEKAAYAYILQQIGGDPRNGQIQGSMISVQTYPAGAAFSQDAFNDVRQHLTFEADYLARIDEWFAPNGLISVINLQIIVAAQNGLISCNALMLMSNDSIVMLILNAVFGVVLRLVSFIPDVGPVIAAVLQLGLSIADIAVGSGGSGANQVRATIAQFAQSLTATSQALADGTAKQHQTMMTNWGRAQRFGKALASGELSPSMVGMVTGSGTANTGPQLSQGYIETTERAWEIAFFQALYYERYWPTINVLVDSSSEPMAQQWNPANGNYNWTFSVPVVIKDSSGNNSAATFYCTGAPAGNGDVMKRLFAPDQLAIDPVSFFMGLDGWMPVVPSTNAYYSSEALSSGTLVSVG